MPEALRRALASRATLDEACAGQRGPDESAVSPEDVEVISPDRQAPAFSVTTTDCQQIESKELIGHSAFVVVFFSSWCGVCDRKMPMIEAAARSLSGRVPFIGVALDDDETWPAVGAFFERHQMTLPLVRGYTYQRFARSYNPFGSIPVVVVVGRDGSVVDAQVGYSAFDYNRLLAMADLAIHRAAPPLSATPSSF